MSALLTLTAVFDSRALAESFAMATVSAYVRATVEVDGASAEVRYLPAWVPTLRELLDEHGGRLRFGRRR